MDQTNDREKIKEMEFFMEEQATKEIAEGTLYGVGVGVGDPKLLTLQAIEILQQADIIAVPDTGGDHTALQIVSTFVEEKAKIFCQMPMTKNQEILQKCHRESADQIISYLKLGKSVAFITLGDPSIYSTYMYLHRLV
ncbi:MAG: precorrin-2 C(20)-methyltransferase, partial [Oscillospiraceae bacterium]